MGGGSMELKDDPVYLATRAEDELQQLNSLLWHKGMLNEKDLAQKALLDVRLLKKILNKKEE